MGPGEQALLQVCKKGDASFAKQLLQTGVDLEVRDKHGKTPLLRAAKYGHVEVIKVLLQHKANLGASSKDKRNVLHMAATAGHDDAVMVLLKFGALSLVDETDDSGKKPLECVPWKKRPKIAEIIQICKEESARAAPPLLPSKSAGHNRRKSMSDGEGQGNYREPRRIFVDPRAAEQHRQGYIKAYAAPGMPPPFPSQQGMPPPYGQHSSMSPRQGGGPGGPPMFNGWNQRPPSRPGQGAPSYGPSGGPSPDTWRCLSQSRVPPPPRQIPSGYNVVAGPMSGDDLVWKTLSTPVAVKPDKRSANWQAATNQLQTGLDLAKEVLTRGNTVRVNGRKCKLFCKAIEQLAGALKQLMVLIQNRSAPDEAVPATKRGLTTVMEMLEAVQILMIEWSACNGCDFGALFMALQRDDFDAEFQTIMKKISGSYVAMTPALAQSGINLPALDALESEYKNADQDDRASMLTTILALNSETGGAKGYSLAKLVEKHSLSMNTLLQLVKKHDIGPQEILEMGQESATSAAVHHAKRTSMDTKPRESSCNGKEEEGDKLDSMKC